MARRKRVLLAWELGRGFGHANRLAPIGRRLEQEGFEARYILRFPEAAKVVGIDPAKVVAAPQWPEPDPSRWTPGQWKREATRTLGQVLGIAGFSERETVSRIAEEWERLVREERPDLAVADYAPSAVMAFRGRVPVIVLGEGYTVPPPHVAEFPPLHSWTDKELFAEDVMLANVNSAQQKLGRPLLDRFVRLMQGDRNLVCTWRLLDPLARYRREPPIGFVAPKMPRPDGRRRDLVFAYLNRSAISRSPVVGLLQNLPKPALVVVPGITTDEGRPLEASGIRITGDLTDLCELLPRCCVAIHQGGNGVASLALSSGVPQLALPSHIESLWTAHALQWAGVGLSVPNGSCAELSEALRRLLDEPHFAAAASREAGVLARDHRQSALDRIAAVAGNLAAISDNSQAATGRPSRQQ